MRFKVTLSNGEDKILEADHTSIDTHNNLVFRDNVDGLPAGDVYIINEHAWDGYRKLPDEG